MAGTTPENARAGGLGTPALGAGAASGVIAGIAMGVVLQLGTDLLPVLGAFVGGTSVLRGWVVHLVISTVYGVLFAVVIGNRYVNQLLDPTGIADYAFGGVVYAAMLMGAGVVGTIAILPFVTELPWTTTAGGSNVPGPQLLGLLPAVVFGIAHVVYGVLVGVAYVVLAGPTRSSSPEGT